jgi:hypothetical protein
MHHVMYVNTISAPTSHTLSTDFLTVLYPANLSNTRYSITQQGKNIDITYIYQLLKAEHKIFNIGAGLTQYPKSSNQYFPTQSNK